MGFGILFVGYFFLINFAYCEFTDTLSAALMLYALYKLSPINESFKWGLYSTLAFTLFSVAELSAEFYDMFSPIPQGSLFLTVIVMARHIVLATVTSFIMLGIKDVAEEVGLRELRFKATRNFYISIGVYLAGFILESAALSSFVPAKVLAVLYVLITFVTVFVIAVNLATIFSAYMQICMPGEEKMEAKKSKFAFVNDFRRHEEEKTREYAEYRMEKIKKSQEKKKREQKNDKG